MIEIIPRSLLALYTILVSGLRSDSYSRQYLLYDCGAYRVRVYSVELHCPPR